MTSLGPGTENPTPKTGKLPPVGDTVDVPNATYKNTIGASELIKVWKDPDFDPASGRFITSACSKSLRPAGLLMTPSIRGQDAPRSSDEGPGAGLHFANLVYAGEMKGNRMI